MSIEWQSEERFNGKTVKSIEYDHCEHIRITFTDGTVMHIYETQQAGGISHYMEGDE